MALLLLDCIGNMRFESACCLSEKRPVFGEIALRASYEEFRAEKHEQDGVLKDWVGELFVG